MLNSIVLVGKIKEIGEKSITITVSRPFKNEKGEYESDNIKVIVNESILKNTTEYCKVGDLIGIKGRLQYINDNPYAYPIAEKVTILSSKKKEEMCEE